MYTFLLYIVGFYLIMFCWEFFYLCSWEIPVCSFHFLYWLDMKIMLTLQNKLKKYFLCFYGSRYSLKGRGSAGRHVWLVPHMLHVLWHLLGWVWLLPLHLSLSASGLPQIWLSLSWTLGSLDPRTDAVLSPCLLRDSEARCLWPSASRQLT